MGTSVQVQSPANALEGTAVVLLPVYVRCNPLLSPLS
ncbi:hypothetical protein FQN60_001765 [Etheostoma spectabile]|uniref:Uncharacterized protein n=1 Tax=Etheostoma spectabile TaxID=54343 RepID=A0A5J5D7V7_9PERO|nr:hypothetical protein FQN60_001765 [Etheostoma spectabile]